MAWKFIREAFSPYNGLTYDEKVLKMFSIDPVRDSTDLMGILPGSYTTVISRINKAYRKSHGKYLITSKQVKERDPITKKFTKMVTTYTYHG